MPTFDIVDGMALFYNDEGQGEPLLLIHGFPLSSELYKPQRAALANRYRVITPDLRAMGRSDVPTNGIYSMDVYADDLVALLDHLGISMITVAGLSMGGYIVFALMRRHPERVKGVILMDTKAGPDTEEGRAGRRKMAEQARAEGAAAIAEVMLPKMLTERTRTEQPELAAFMREMMAATPVEGIVGALDALANRPDSTNTLAQIQVPTLIIVGSEDALTPPSEAEKIRAGIRGAQLVVVDGAAHAANVERPDEVNQALEAFVDQLG